MNYKSLVISVLCAAGALMYYMFHRWWLKAHKEKEGVLNKDLKHSKNLINWLIIIMLIFASIAYLVEAIE